ncbi:MAG: hypothetical protein JNL01_06690 [Bdellovibrionales bacterium]|nr:hypothetical protein [Bdellovibrionales bacterium]
MTHCKVKTKLGNCPVLSFNIDKMAKDGLKTGKESVVDMLKVMDPGEREKLLGNLAQKDPILAEELSRRMESIEDLLKVEGLILQKFLREVPAQQLALAMRKVSDELKAHLFSQLSERARKTLQEEIDQLGPQKVSSIQQAQVDIRARFGKWLRSQAETL